MMSAPKLAYQSILQNVKFLGFSLCLPTPKGRQEIACINHHNSGEQIEATASLVLKIQGQSHTFINYFYFVRIQISYQRTQASQGSTVLPWIVKRIPLLSSLRGRVYFIVCCFQKLVTQGSYHPTLNQKPLNTFIVMKKVFHNGQFERCKSYSLSLRFYGESWF